MTSNVMSEPGKKGPAREGVDCGCRAETFELVYPEKGFRLVTEHVRPARALHSRSGSYPSLQEHAYLKWHFICAGDPRAASVRAACGRAAVVL